MAAAMIQSFDADQRRYELICVSRLEIGHSSDQALRRRKPGFGGHLWPVFAMHPIWPPKIVSSTATIRRYGKQVRDLYGRDTVSLFPPPGLKASDSFFAQYAKQPDGSLAPGRIYLGVHAPGLGSLQTAQVRAFTGLLQAPLALPEDARDPWWTVLAFFNSLRELGTTLSLFQSDIPDYLKVIRNRTGTPPDRIRRLRNMKELTGRLPSEEIPLAISMLEAEYGGRRAPVDVCLASNIIEVGIDIDRSHS
jgi:hypothetical protein